MDRHVGHNRLTIQTSNNDSGEDLDHTNPRPGPSIAQYRLLCHTPKMVEVRQVRMWMYQTLSIPPSQRLVQLSLLKNCFESWCGNSPWLLVYLSTPSSLELQFAICISSNTKKPHEMTFTPYPNEVYTTFSFLGFIMCMIPFAWHLKGQKFRWFFFSNGLNDFWPAWNAGTCLHMFWAGIECLIFCINSIVWHGNTFNPAPIWCDICKLLSIYWSQLIFYRISHEDYHRRFYWHPCICPLYQPATLPVAIKSNPKRGHHEVWQDARARRRPWYFCRDPHSFHDSW